VKFVLGFFIRAAPKLPHWTLSLGHPAFMLIAKEEDDAEFSFRKWSSLLADDAIIFGLEPPSWMTSLGSMEF
jgi:hypothetical protein